MGRAQRNRSLSVVQAWTHRPTQTYLKLQGKLRCQQAFSQGAEADMRSRYLDTLCAATFWLVKWREKRQGKPGSDKSNTAKCIGIAQALLAH